MPNYSLLWEILNPCFHSTAFSLFCSLVPSSYFLDWTLSHLVLLPLRMLLTCIYRYHFINSGLGFLINYVTHFQALSTIPGEWLTFPPSSLDISSQSPGILYIYLNALEHMSPKMGNTEHRSYAHFNPLVALPVFWFFFFSAWLVGFCVLLFYCS